MAPGPGYPAYQTAPAIAGNYAPQASPPDAGREGTVSTEIRDLHAQLQSLDDVTSKLRSRLEALLLDRPQVAQGQQGGSQPSRCKVAGDIHTAVDLACGITAKVTDMLCCLEL